MKIMAAFFLLLAGNAMAQCENSTHLTDIPYAKNSSYFPSQYSLQLDRLASDAQAQSGYLLLEFRLNRRQANEESRSYNMWLANRRIERIKQYLTEANYPAPIVSRILTASNTDSRKVSLQWCAENDDEGKTRLAD